MDWRKSLFVEHKVADIISRQSKRGVYFQTQRAKWLIHVLNERILKIDLEAVPQMPPMIVQAGAFSKPFLKSGLPNKRLVALWQRLGHFEVSGPFTAIEYKDFDLGKTARFKDWMLSQGWIPDQWNIKDITVGTDGKKLRGSDLNGALNRYIEDLRSSPSGLLRMKLQGIIPGKTTVGEVKRKLEKQRKVLTTPKMTETSMDTVQGDLGKLVMQRMVWAHRRSLLQGLVEQVKPNGRLEGSANPCATPTGRMRHRVVVNIPAARSPFGPEIRGLFQGTPNAGEWKWTVLRRDIGENERVRPHTNIVEVLKGGKWKTVGKYRVYVPANQLIFVGYDGAGLELRMLASYIGDPDYTREVVDGDVHTANQIAAGLPTRDDAKTFIYAFIYGAGDAKIGQIIGGTRADGARLREQFLKANPELAKLIERVKQEAERGYLVGLDGRKLTMRRSESGEVMVHKALNTLLQAAGAIVMKWAMVILDEKVRRAGLKAWKVLDIHDEGQWECHPEDLAALREFMETCVKEAGEILGCNCPLASDSIAGRSWYDTH
ncbi:DNA polymerase [Klebsiella pneumoniae]|uniref:DNA polymerase n=1 Tax=Klebsiella pneumoniae TaxID=573 RepID=UPI00137753B5|nr:DNA polymerase [Klebsiella pneumoniae]